MCRAVLSLATDDNHATYYNIRLIVSDLLVYIDLLAHMTDCVQSSACTVDTTVVPAVIG